MTEPDGDDVARASSSKEMTFADVSKDELARV